MHPAIQTNILLVAVIGFAIWITGNPLCLVLLYLLQAPQPSQISQEELDALMAERTDAQASQMTFVDTNE
jgi:hypothetical protein